MLKLLISRCARCSKTGAHSDHFLLHINRQRRAERWWSARACSNPKVFRAHSRKIYALKPANKTLSNTALGLALPCGRDGRVVAQDRRLVDVGEHGGGARRRRARDGGRAEEAARGLRAPQRPRLAVRLAAARQDDAGGRDRAVGGVDSVALGQRRHGVAHGRHQGRVRARAHLRESRARGPRDLRVHRVLLQQGQDALGAGLPQPRGVRAGQLARGGMPPDGGVGV